MNIGLFSDTYIPDINGVANSTHILRCELEKHGHNVYVVATRPGAGLSEWDEDHKVLRLPGIVIKQLYGYAVTTPFHVHAANEIKKLDLDLIHVQTEFGVGIFAKIIARQFDIPVVYTYHTVYEDYTHYLNPVNSKVVDSVAKLAVVRGSRLYGDTSLAVIAPSDKTKTLLEKYGVRTRIFIVPTGLDLASFSPSLLDQEKTDAIRKEAGFAKDDTVIIYVGRLAEEKALDIVLKGFSLARKKGSRVKFLIVGGGPDEEKLRRMAKELELGDTVYFTGKKPPAEVPDHYRSADAFISASLSETQGMTFIEAMASGLPLLARRDEVLEDLIIPDQTGWYFSDEEDLAERLLELEKTAEPERLAYRRACLERVLPYSSERFYEGAMEVYEYALELFRHMNIVNEITTKDDFVRLTIRSEEGGEVTVSLTPEDYMGEGLRKGSRITDQMLEKLKERERAALAWQKCLRRLGYKDRTVSEVREWLLKECGCDEEEADEITGRLQVKGYLNDEQYADDVISRMHASLKGEKAIRQELQRRGISAEIIDKKLSEVPEEDEENAAVFAERVLKTPSSDSARMKKQKLRNKMAARGFSSDIIDEVTAGISDDLYSGDEMENLRRSAEKAKNKYSRKYTSSQLQNAVYRYCSSRGFRSEDIHAVLDEMEWDL